MGDVSVQVKDSEKVQGVRDTVEYWMHHLKAFGQALQCGLVHLVMRDIMATLY